MVELIAKRYGLALFEIAVENDEVDKIKEEVEALVMTIESTDDFIDIISHPKISTEEKEKMIEEVFSDKFSKDLLGLIDLVIKKGRQQALLPILNSFLGIVDEHQNISKVKVTTVDPITDEYRKALIAKLEGITNKSIVLEEEIDPSIVGGIIIRISDRIVDNSIAGQMKKFAKELLTHTKV